MFYEEQKKCIFCGRPIGKKIIGGLFSVGNISVQDVCEECISKNDNIDFLRPNLLYAISPKAFDKGVSSLLNTMYPIRNKDHNIIGTTKLNLMETELSIRIPVIDFKHVKNVLENIITNTVFPREVDSLIKDVYMMPVDENVRKNIVGMFLVNPYDNVVHPEACGIETCAYLNINNIFRKFYEIGDNEDESFIRNLGVQSKKLMSYLDICYSTISKRNKDFIDKFIRNFDRNKQMYEDLKNTEKKKVMRNPCRDDYGHGYSTSTWDTFRGNPYYSSTISYSTSFYDSSSTS